MFTLIRFFSFMETLDQDSAGRSMMKEQHFTLEDGLTPSFDFVQSFILLTDHYILGRVLFVFTVLLNVGVLLAFRFRQLPNGKGELYLIINFIVLQRTLNINLYLWHVGRSLHPLLNDAKSSYFGTFGNYIYFGLFLIHAVSNLSTHSPKLFNKMC